MSPFVDRIFYNYSAIKLFPTSTSIAVSFKEQHEFIYSNCYKAIMSYLFT